MSSESQVTVIRIGTEVGTGVGTGLRDWGGSDRSSEIWDYLGLISERSAEICSCTVDMITETGAGAYMHTLCTTPSQSCLLPFFTILICAEISSCTVVDNIYDN